MKRPRYLAGHLQLANDHTLKQWSHFMVCAARDAERDASPSPAVRVRCDRNDSQADSLTSFSVVVVLVALSFGVHQMF